MVDFLFHIVGSLVWNGSISNTVLYGAVFFVGANLLGMFGAYHSEDNKRKHFLHELELGEVNAAFRAQYEEKANQYDQLMTSLRENQELDL
ncbi:MAG: hypothetical protein MZU97_15075 [Bacillus subtilis]|nr:hypothetical protein [Bacillus subtilis]